jgi:hypothetical protein
MPDHANQRWEYRVEPSPDESVLTTAGGDGWELVAIDAERGWIFKRPTPGFRDRVTLEQKARYYESWARQGKATS